VNGLFLVHDNSDIEFNRDLVVAATDWKQALVLWRAYYEMGKKDEPVSIFRFPAVISDAPQVIRWNDTNGMVAVWASKKTRPAI
jgi:hypothetical protein